jgi:hypothetical protein
VSELPRKSLPHSQPDLPFVIVRTLNRSVSQPAQLLLTTTRERRLCSCKGRFMLPRCRSSRRGLCSASSWSRWSRQTYGDALSCYEHTQKLQRSKLSYALTADSLLLKMIFW